MDLQDLEDRLTVRELIERYSLAVSVRDWDALGATFHPDASWEVTPPTPFLLKTRPEIQAGIRDAVLPFDSLVQMVHSIIIELSRDRATARSVVNESGQHLQSGSTLNIFGVYNDEITRVDGRWGFARRYFEVLRLDTQGPMFEAPR